MLETILTHAIVAGVFFALGGMCTLWQMAKFDDSGIVEPFDIDDIQEVKWSLN